MPLPAYIICSQSGALDEMSNQVSAFNIVEALKIFKKPIKSFNELNPKQINSGLVRIVAAWLKEETDSSDQVFEVSLSGHFPGNNKDVVFGNTQFSFAKPVQRAIVHNLLLAQFWASGILRIEAKIRRLGEESWLHTLSFPIILEEVPLPDANSTLACPDEKPLGKP